MQTPSEVYKRLESSGALLALSASIVQYGFADEDEIRLLFDASASMGELDTRAVFEESGGVSLLRLPCQWSEVIEDVEHHDIG